MTLAKQPKTVAVRLLEFKHPSVSLLRNGGDHRARMNAKSNIRSSGNEPGLQSIHNNPSADCSQAGWLNAFVMPVLRGSAAASVTFWASAASSVVCSVSVSNCLREWPVDNSMNSAGDFTPAGQERHATTAGTLRR